MDLRRHAGRHARRHAGRHRRRRVPAALIAFLVVVEVVAFAAAPGRLRPSVLPFATAEPSAARPAGPTEAPNDPAGPDRAGADRSDADPTSPPADPATALAARGVTFGPGWEPEGILGGRDPWSAFDPAEGAAAWVPHLTPRTDLVLDGEPFRERAVVGRDPAPCYHFHRTVRDVSVGLPDPAGARIEADLLAWLEPPYFSGVVRTRLDPRCVGRPRSQYGFAIEEVWRVPCAPPPGRASGDVRCFAVGQWAYHLGERDVRWAAHLVYDAATGEPIDGEGLHVGVDVVTWRAFVEEAVCTSGGRCDGVAHRHGQLLPTADALLVEFAAGEAVDAALGTRRLVVPWSVLADLTAGRSIAG